MLTCVLVGGLDVSIARGPRFGGHDHTGPMKAVSRALPGLDDSDLLVICSLPFRLPPFINSVNVQRSDGRVGIISRPNDLVDIRTRCVRRGQDSGLVQDRNSVTTSLVHPQGGTDAEDAYSAGKRRFRSVCKGHGHEN